MLSIWSRTRRLLSGQYLPRRQVVRRYFSVHATLITSSSHRHRHRLLTHVFCNIPTGTPSANPTKAQVVLVPGKHVRTITMVVAMATIVMCKVNGMLSASLDLLQQTPLRPRRLPLSLLELLLHPQLPSLHQHLSLHRKGTPVTMETVVIRQRKPILH